MMMMVAGRASLDGKTGTVNANRKGTLNWQPSSELDNQLDADLIGTSPFWTNISPNKSLIVASGKQVYLKIFRIV